MRLSSLALFLGASALGAAEPNADADERQTSVFNGQKVPALLELTPDNFDTMVKASKNLVVKYFRYEQAINPSFPSYVRLVVLILRLFINPIVSTD